MLLGLDVGTTNLKAVAYDQDTGRIQALARRPTRTLHPRSGWAEFLPDDLWTEARAAMRAVVDAIAPSTITAVAVASMGEGGVLLDDNGQALAPIIAWYDSRTEEQARWWKTMLDPWTIYQVTGLIVDSKYSVNHLLWLRQHRPEQFAAGRRWLSVSDFLIWKLTGEFATDLSIASRTMLFDQRTQQWSTELLALAQLSPELLAPVLPGGTRVGRISASAADETGLSRDVIVATGGHDHLVGALGAGLIQTGGALDSTGTAGAVIQIADRFDPDRALFDAGLETYAFLRREKYVLLGSLNLAGGAVEWLLRLLAEDASAVFAAAALVRRGSDGAMWLPHLLGSGTPDADPVSRAALIGLRPEHTRAHVVRSLLESLAYWLRQNLEVSGLPTTSPVVAIGGGARSSFWTQIKADVCGRTFIVPQVEECVALGAALLAGLGDGSFADADQAVGSVRHTQESYLPRPTAVSDYDRWYTHVYLRLYAALRDINATIQAFASDE